MEGGTPGQADDEASLKVCETPQVGDIPDQTGSPFDTVNLDGYLVYTDGLEVSWSATASDEDWTVEIDENVATITPPERATDPATITFTASVECCTDVTCSDSDEATFTPNQPPNCSEAYANPNYLWPPNHKFVPVSILNVTDPDGDIVNIAVDSIYQDEPVDAVGSGNTCLDGAGVGTDTAEVLAERTGDKNVPGDGRVYHISFSADDEKGGTCSGEVTVCVPHDQGQGNACIDGGALYDSTSCP